MPPDDARYVEDLAVGQGVDCGSVEVDREEMVAFAERYDPQPFHVDEAAAESMDGDLVASGWLTCALSARQLVTGYVTDTATLGGNGIDDLRWHRPVQAGDELSVQVELVENRGDG